MAAAAAVTGRLTDVRRLAFLDDPPGLPAPKAPQLGVPSAVGK